MKKHCKYPNLLRKAEYQRVKMVDMAISANISERVLYNKLWGNPRFTDDEAYKIWTDWFPDEDRAELFRLEETDAKE